VEVQHLDWAHTGGIARYSLDVWGVRQGTARPSDELLALLKRVTFEEWNYFYYRLGEDSTRGLQAGLHPP
jgi:hypothetical protein